MCCKCLLLLWHEGIQATCSFNDSKKLELIDFSMNLTNIGDEQSPGLVAAGPELVLNQIW